MNALCMEAARLMRQELEARRLEVCKVRFETGEHGTTFNRMAVMTNAEWYQSFCAEWEKRRRRYPKRRTIIKRCHTIRALKEIEAGRCNTTYAERLLPHVEKFIEDYELYLEMAG